VGDVIRDCDCASSTIAASRDGNVEVTVISGSLLSLLAALAHSRTLCFRCLRVSDQFFPPLRAFGLRLLQGHEQSFGLDDRAGLVSQGPAFAANRSFYLIRGFPLLALWSTAGSVAFCSVP